jgi:hypothetical protein
VLLHGRRRRHRLDDIARTAFWDFGAAIGRRCVIHRSNPNVGALAVRRAA